MKAAIEISMYPLGSEYRPKIQAFIDRLHTHAGLTITTNQLSTQLWGDLDLMFAVLGEEMTRAAGLGPQPVFVMKVLPGLGPAEA